MRINLVPSCLKIALACAGLFAAACGDISRDPPLFFSGIQTADRDNDSAEQSKQARLMKVWTQVARQAIANGHPETAIRFARKAADAAPDSTEPLRVLAQAYRLQDGGNPRILAQEAPKPASKAPANVAAAPSSPTPPEQFEPLMAAIAEKLSEIAPATGSNQKSATKPAAAEERAPVSPVVASRGAAKPVVEPPRTAAPVRQTDPKPQRAQKSRQVTSVSRNIRRNAPVSQPKSTQQTPAYRVQLGAYASLDAATRGQKILSRKLPASFPKLGVFERRGAAAEGKRVNYRIRSKVQATEVEAIALCDAVTASGVSCLPIRQTSNVWQFVNANPNSDAAKIMAPRQQKRANRDVKNSEPKTAAIQVSASLSDVSPTASGPAKKQSLYRIQLAAYRDLAWAVRGKDILTKNLPENFPSLDILKRHTADTAQTQINYRVRSHGLWQKERALALCEAARLAGYGCLLLEPVGSLWRSVAATAPPRPANRLDRRT